MTVSYSYDKLKVLQALRFHFINKKDIRLLLIAVNVLALASGILFFLKKIEPTVFVFTSFMWIVLMLLLWFLMPRLIYNRTRSFKDNFITEITNENIVLQQENGSRTWMYEQFQSWFESPHFFHLYIGANSFFVLPKDAFTMEQTQEARAIFKAKIK
jgi:YcxB-like protein